MTTTRAHGLKAAVAERKGPHSSIDAAFTLENNLAYRLSLLSFLVNTATSRIYNSAGLSTNQWKILSVLNAHEPMSAQAIERWVTLDKAAISRTVQQLLKLKLVHRRLHSTNARMIDIKMTARGRRMYDAIAQQTAAHQATLLQDVSGSDCRALFRGLKQIEEALRSVQQMGH